MSLLTITSIPFSKTAVILHVTISPFFNFKIPPATGSFVNCLTPRLIRSFSTSISRIFILIISPFVHSAIASSPDLTQSRSDMWTIPSMSSVRPTNRPNSVIFFISPSSSSSTLCFSVKSIHGFLLHCLRPRLIRRLDVSTSKTITSTS